jgi:hypothetical protein
MERKLPSLSLSPSHFLTRFLALSRSNTLESSFTICLHTNTRIRRGERRRLLKRPAPHGSYSGGGGSAEGGRGRGGGRRGRKANLALDFELRPSPAKYTASCCRCCCCFSFAFSWTLLLDTFGRQCYKTRLTRLRHCGEVSGKLDRSSLVSSSWPYSRKGNGPTVFRCAKNCRGQTR